MGSNTNQNPTMQVDSGAANLGFDAALGNFVTIAASPGTQKNTTNALLISGDGYKATYRYAVQGFAPVATPTAFCIIAGSASKTIRVKQIRIGGGATAAGAMAVQMARWSTAGTLGSAVLTAITAVKNDTGDADATATISTVGTANYTTQGTGNGTLLAASRIPMPALTTGGAETTLLYDFCADFTKAFILRGTTDILAISGGGSAVPSGGVIDIEIVTEEDNS